MKLLSITVRGNDKKWSFNFYGDPKHIDDWREDGLEIDEVENTIPDWLPHWLVKPWCKVQDVFNFKLRG